MWKNRFGISEPIAAKLSDELHHGAGSDTYAIGFGFDLRNRLGGGGYHDRTLAYLKRRSHWHRPTLIGMAHECQRLLYINTQSWDIPLDGIVSENGLYLVNKKLYDLLVFFHSLYYTQPVVIHTKLFRSFYSGRL